MSIRTTVITLILFYSSIVLSKPLKIGVLYWSSTIEGQVAMRCGLEQRAKELQQLGILDFQLLPFVAGDGTNGILNQIKQFKHLVLQEKVDAIIIQPTDNAALARSLQLANKNRIPVVAYDQYIVGGSLSSYITSNNYQAGQLNAEYIYPIFHDEIKIVTVDGDPASVANIQQGRLTVIDSAQFCGELGRQSMQTIFDLLTGKPVSKKILIPTFPIVKETLHIYKGWKAKIPKPFKKSWKKNELWNNQAIHL